MKKIIIMIISFLIINSIFKLNGDTVRKCDNCMGSGTRWVTCPSCAGKKSHVVGSRTTTYYKVYRLTGIRRIKHRKTKNISRKCPECGDNGIRRGQIQIACPKCSGTGLKER